VLYLHRPPRSNVCAPCQAGPLHKVEYSSTLAAVLLEVCRRSIHCIQATVRHSTKQIPYRRELCRITGVCATTAHINPLVSYLKTDVVFVTHLLLSVIGLALNYVTFSVFNVFHVRALQYTKTLITNKMHKESFIINCNTLLHVSTLLGHLQGEHFVIVTLRLHLIVE
jgi:hypothetical protein